jgi:hypothetical protein
MEPVVVPVGDPVEAWLVAVKDEAVHGIAQDLGLWLVEW